MSDKYLSKNEFRFDNNLKHFGKEEKPHPAYITARKKHYLKANSITHAKMTTDGKETFLIKENPDKLSKDKRQTRISPPYWQKDTMFSKEKLKNFRFSNSTRKVIKKYNKKFK